MAETLIRGAQTILTMDDVRSELAGADIRISCGVITEIGIGLAQGDATLVLADQCVVTPGARRAAVWLVANALPHMGAFWPRRGVCFCSDRSGGTGIVRMHDDV